MSKNFFLMALLVWTCNSAQQSSESIQSDTNLAIPYATSISAQDLKEHLYIYASDSLEGRETGSEGQKKAANYLRNYYRAQKVIQAPGTESYFQEVPLELSRIPEGGITVNGKLLNNGKDFMSFKGASGSLEALIYVGYGIETDDYSDYSNFDVSGKWLIMKAGEPQLKDGTYVLTGTNDPSPWSNQSEAIGKRTEVAKAKGALGFFYVDDLNFARYNRYFNYMKRNQSGQMGLQSQNLDPGMILLSSAVFQSEFPELEGLTVPKSIGAKIELNLNSADESLTSENVVAYIPGSTWPDEYVIISSHLDHIGVTSEGAINNGADDDGSGTVALLEIAQAFKAATIAGNGPKRSVVFLHVTGEEKGLLGSQYYTDIQPLFPLSQTVANLNIDMIGRTDPNRSGSSEYVYLIGSDKLSTELHEISEAINSQFSQLELDYTFNDENDPNRFYYRSDHYNFAKNNIPIIFYFNGTHEDYHRPGDTPDKIEYELLEKRTRLVFYTAWELANRTKRITVDKAP
ncbi:MAG: hypothetical protein RLZZ241_1820 [Bacteroidota bacterium]